MRIPTPKKLLRQLFWDQRLAKGHLPWRQQGVRMEEQNSEAQSSVSRNTKQQTNANLE